jgi:hypothetical protein
MNKKTFIEIAILVLMVLGFAIAGRLAGGAPLASLLPW